MIEPEAEIAAAVTESGEVGVLATPATVRSGAYLQRARAPAPRADRDRGRGARPGGGDPARLPLRPERGRDGAHLLRAAEAGAEVDTVILGCTHYPLVAPMLQRTLGRDVRLVTAGHAIAAASSACSPSASLAADGSGRGRVPLHLHRGPRGLPRARHPLPADAARRGRAGRAAVSGVWLADSAEEVDVPLWPWGVLLIVLAVYVVAVAAVLAAGRREDARALAGFIPDCVVLVSRLARDRAHLPAAAGAALRRARLPGLPDRPRSRTSCPARVSWTTRSCSRSRCGCWLAAATAEMIREAWPGPEASLNVVLRAAGLHGNGAGAPGSAATL